LGSVGLSLKNVPSGPYRSRNASMHLTYAAMNSSSLAKSRRLFFALPQSTPGTFCTWRVFITSTPSSTNIFMSSSFIGPPMRKLFQPTFLRLSRRCLYSPVQI